MGYSLKRAAIDAINILSAVQIRHHDSVGSKELKAVIDVCVSNMSAIANRQLGRGHNLFMEDINKYKNIAYSLAHQYTPLFPLYDKEEIFSEFVSAAMEGLAQGLARYSPTKNTKISTFLFSRARFAVQKLFSTLKKNHLKSGLSLNAKITNDGEEAEFHQFLPSQYDATDDIVYRNIRVIALRRAIKKLPKSERKVIIATLKNGGYEKVIDKKELVAIFPKLKIAVLNEEALLKQA